MCAKQTTIQLIFVFFSESIDNNYANGFPGAQARKIHLDTITILQKENVGVKVN